MAELDLQSLCARSGWKPEPLLDALGSLPSFGTGGPWVAGGCLRRLLMGQDALASDIDVFFASEEQANCWEKDMMNALATKVVSKMQQATTYRVHVPKSPRPLKVQAVRLSFYASPAELLNSFDFTICQFAWDGESLHAGEHALWDLGRRRLVVHKVTYAAATLRRLLKYHAQGFKACRGVAVSILQAVADDPSVIHPEVEYVD